MAGAGDSTDAADVVRFWLATRTWPESFAVLRAGAALLATQAGLDAVVEHVDGAARAMHATLLQMVASCWPVDRLQQLVTGPIMALQMAVGAAAKGDAGFVSRALLLNSAVADSVASEAVLMAAPLPNDPDRAAQTARALADRDSARVRETACVLRQLAEALDTPDRFTDLPAILDPQ